MWKYLCDSIEECSGVEKYLCGSIDGCRGWRSTFVILEMGAGDGEVTL